MGYRLSVVRGFAAYVHTLDPASEVPPADLLPHRPRRANPYLYSDTDVAALIAATATLRSPLRQATLAVLIGLLTVTGMRVGEAIALDHAAVDLTRGLLLVLHGKFGKPGNWPCIPAPSPRCAAISGYGIDSPRPPARRRSSCPRPGPG